ncbi:unnamed protein product [Aphanomyces euteiches]|uniref:Uncharacterized protein n=1 Tax=Aphanomyces euteiches TaxID=100861 RepID=A0A6G0X810_9STRA|nr:hypothetical protein Ae201684_007628 [Aphanomyces euteiches]KAH9138530.1 hypothetical protein AeRB84_017195 [Aphanomyces euteiches]
MADDWDITADLDFLLPGVAEFEADLAFVCDLITAEPATEVVEPSKPPPQTKRTPNSLRRRKQRQPSQRELILQLQKQVGELEDQLKDAKYEASSGDKESKWETLARRQRNQARKALQEQHELQDAVESNGSFIGKLVTLLRKRPRHQEDLVKDWQVYRLPAEPTERRATIHVIAEQQRARKNTEFIVSGLSHRTENILRVRPIVHATAQAVKYEVTSYVKLPAPCAVVSRAIWQVYANENIPQSSATAQVVHEHVDDHTIYERFTETRDGVTSYGCTVEKYFTDDKEHLLILQSVVEDELQPHMSSGAVENESVWTSIEPLDECSCCVKLLVHLIFSAGTYPSGMYDRSIEAITESLGDVQLEEKIPQDGLFINRLHIPQAVDKFPGYASFASRRIQLKAALRKAVYQSVQDYQQSTALDSVH